MKKLSIFLLAIIAILSFNSCSEDDDFSFVAKESPAGVMFLNSTAQVYSLSASNKDNLAERFVWNEVDFDVQTDVRYELQASTSESFDNISLLAEDITETNAAVTVGQMLELAEEAELDNDPETDAPNTGNLYFRVRAYTGAPDATNVVEQFSDVMTLVVVLPEAAVEEEPAKLQLYMVGNASPDGWNNNNNNTPLFRDPENDNIFYYTGYFAANDIAGQDDEDFAFKFLTTLGQWAPMYGPTEDSYATSGSLMFRETEQDPDTGRIMVETAGYYSLVVNLDEMTYTFEPYDASAATTYNVIGLVGDGTSVGWPGDDNPTPDIELTQSTHDDHLWFTENVELNGKSAKFRANLAWDKGWAGPFPSGLGVSDGDIPTVEGTYNVWFNDLDGRYIFIPVVSE